MTLSNEIHHNHGTSLIRKNRLIITGFAVGATAGYFGIGGGFVGAKLSTKIHREKLVKIFSILLIFVALFIIVKTV